MRLKSIFGRISRFLARPPEQRARILKLRTQWFAGAIFFRLLGWNINHRRSPLLLVYKPQFDYVCDRFPEYRAFREYWVHGNAQNRGDLLRLYTIALNAKQLDLDDVRGDFAELGVYKGNSAKVLSALKGPRHLYLFDTFSGFDRRDLRNLDKTHRGDSFSDVSLDDVRSFVGIDGVSYAAGWFPQSVSAAASNARYALVHIDCDLYDPAKAALEFFYPRLSPGGLLLIHDYSSGLWPGLTQAVDEFIKTIGERLVLIPDASGTASLRKSQVAVR